VLDEDAQQGAAQDGQLAVPVVLEPAAVAVDERAGRPPGIDADGAVQGRARQGQRLVWLGVRLAGVVVAGDGDAVPGRAAVPAGPGDRVAVHDAAGRQPDQQVHVLPGQGGGQRGGAVPGVEDGQRRSAVVPGRAQPPEQLPDLACSLARAAGPGGARDIGDGGPRGA
jgi:hypothetical protein